VWRMVALISQLVPVAWRDDVYDAVARARYRLFRKPESACPLLPGHLRSRFE
jgi:predicted DCC family thiol-disulfide oxidoreductase YuxK